MMIGVPVPTKKFHFGFRKKKKTPHLVRLEDFFCFFFIMGISDKVHEFSVRV